MHDISISIFPINTIGHSEFAYTWKNLTSVTSPFTAWYAARNNILSTSKFAPFIVATVVAIGVLCGSQAKQILLIKMGQKAFPFFVSAVLSAANVFPFFPLYCLPRMDYYRDLFVDSDLKYLKLMF